MALPADLHTTQLVLREAEYYQLTGLTELLAREARHLKQTLAEVRALQRMIQNGHWALVY